MNPAVEVGSWVGALEPDLGALNAQSCAEEAQMAVKSHPIASS